MGHVGKAIITANATTCCGFLVLTFSTTEFLQNFALVNSLAIFLVTVSVLTFLPALITLFQMEGKTGDDHMKKLPLLALIAKMSYPKPIKRR
jgi:predicted RND superfamily exporter protein